MKGSILNNSQILDLRKNEDLILSPWRDERLKLAHYALTPAGILWANKLGNEDTNEQYLQHDFDLSGEYVFQPNEYAIVEIEELIVLPKGIIGHFLPSSILIQRGFGLTAGKVDSSYGALKGRTQKIQFGVKNLLNSNNVLSSSMILAHVYFIDLRGLDSLPVEFSEPQMQDFLSRFSRFKKENDDGPTYPE